MSGIEGLTPLTRMGQIREAKNCQAWVSLPLLFILLIPASASAIPIVAAGYYHTCALLDNGTVKCWGANLRGGLGLGDTVSRGDGPGEMGNNLPTVSLGTGRTAAAITAGEYFSCAVLDNGTVKCWGQNSEGQLGLGDIDHRGDGPGEMGDSLPIVSLGTGRTATAIASGLSPHACALLDNNTVKCWGKNSAGQLGLGDTNSRGDGPSEMGDSLPTISLGTGRTATAITAGISHTCALLDNGMVKCWGLNSYGGLGLEDTVSRGDGPSEMGDSLPTVSLGTGRTATAIAAGGYHTCALLDNGMVKCWGQNNGGQLGLGDINHRGDGPGEMGDSLPAVSLGTGRMAIAIASGVHDICAVLDNSTVKCWGENGAGQLGLGGSGARGDGPGEMGDNLPIVAIVDPPSSPGSFGGSVLGTSSITWTWANVSYEDGFKVISSSDGNMSGNLAANNLSFTETNLSTNTAYTRRVMAFNIGGASSSTAATLYTLAAPPTGFAFVEVGVSSLTVSWGANDNSLGTSYRIDRWTAGGSTTTMTITVTSATLDGLFSSTTYYLTIRAVNGDGVSTPSGITLSTMTSVDMTLPTGFATTPTDAGIYVNSSSLTFSWTQGSAADAESGIAGYYLQVGSAPAGSNLFDGDAGNILTKTATGAVDGQTYYARVRVKNGDGLYGSWSENSNGIMVDLTAPGAPSVIVSTTHPDSVNGYPIVNPSFGVSGPNDLSGIAGYYWKIDSLSGAVLTSTHTFSSTGSIQTADLLADGTWYFHVAAKDGAGNIGTSAAYYKFIVDAEVNPLSDNVYNSTDGVKIEIPAGAVSSATQLIIQTPSAPPAPPDGDSTVKATPVVRDIKMADGTKNFQKEVTITLPYTASDVAGMNENSLRLFFYDENQKYWALVSNSTVDTANKKVSGGVRHFTLFRIMEYTPAASAIVGLSSYPNPFAPLKGETARIRYNLDQDRETVIRIYDVMGGLVWDKTIAAGESGGRMGPNEVSWDGKTGDGRWAAADVYICLIEAGWQKVKWKIGVK
ncbi:MAG: fibronectin type III domain-containing protein [Elusimicrobia bacterium]|nr:fibronectin type III domain-containing protein [Elusimicrobiota bacterium]